MKGSLSNSFELTFVKPSSIHGFGLFAARDIPKGTIWWKGENNFNVMLLNREQFFNFEKSEPNHIKPAFWNMFSTYSYYSAKLDSLILCLDNARYVNHSDTPNSGPSPDANPLMSIALRDIHVGEEILENYDEYDQCPWTTIYKFELAH